MQTWRENRVNGGEDHIMVLGNIWVVIVGCENLSFLRFAENLAWAKIGVARAEMGICPGEIESCPGDFVRQKILRSLKFSLGRSYANRKRT